MKVYEDFTTRSKIEDIGRWYVTQFVKLVSEGLPSEALILDAGAGECAYKRYFPHCKYVSVDLAVGEDSWNYKNLDCVAALDNLPFEEGSFDAILCTQVLEHLEWPRESVKEFHRILKPGGRLFLTVPMAHKEHQVPYDFFRYTSFGLKSICKHAEFNQIEITPLGGMFTRMAYELPRTMSVFPVSGFRNGQLRLKDIILLPLKIVCLIAIRVAQMALLGMDRFDKIRNDPFGWSAIARK